MPSEWAKALRPCVVFRKITNGYLMISWCHALANRAITAATCLVAQVQRGALLAKFLERPLCYQSNRNQNLTVAAFFGYRNGDFLFVNVETNEAHLGHSLLLSWEYSVRRRSFPFYTSGAVASVGRS
jgi:hypothetical protein